MDTTADYSIVVFCPRRLISSGSEVICRLIRRQNWDIFAKNDVTTLHKNNILHQHAVFGKIGNSVTLNCMVS